MSSDRNHNASGDSDGRDPPPSIADAPEEQLELELESGSSSSSSAAASEERRSRPSGGLMERLTSALLDGRDADLLLHKDDVENGVMRWLRALDLQLLGACRADERLKPLLKLNSSSPSGPADDHLMSQLSQHFEASEVGMLVRCLCLPLVSTRVGKVKKQGNLMCPTNTRGHLNLTLLPSSDMHILFCGDDGHNEKIATVPHNFEFKSYDVAIEAVSADNSGRSFFLKLPGDQMSYFWCSEKSRLHGSELLEKMKNLLQRRPSLSQLTGICESRLDSFATHLRLYLLVSTNSAETSSTTSSDAFLSSTTSSVQESDLNSSTTFTISKSSRPHSGTSQLGKMPLYQGSLSPRSNSFKDTLSRSSLSLRNGTREKFKRRVDSIPNPIFTNSPTVTTSSLSDVCLSSDGQFDEDKIKGENHRAAFSLPELTCLISSASSFDTFPFCHPIPQHPAPIPSLYSPYYCWCPPCTSSFSHVATPPTLPSITSDSSPLSGGSVSFLPLGSALDQSQLQPFEPPSVFPTKYAAMPSSQQIPTFIPFMSDSIVHIPVIDVCSSGPGYIVSAGPSISSAIIPPLLPSLVHPLTTGPESIVEKNARETLRMLMASAPSSAQLIQVLPTVSEIFPCIPGRNVDMMVTGSRGLYTGAQDVDAVSNSFCFMNLTPTPTRTVVSGDCALRSEVSRKNWWTDDGQKHEGEKQIEEPEA